MANWRARRPTGELAAALPNPMLDAHRAWIEGLTHRARQVADASHC